MPSGHRFQFRLRTLLLLITALAICLGKHVDRVHRQRAAIAEIRRRHGGFGYGEFRRTYAPRWLWRMLGTEFFMPVAEVRFAGGSATTDADLRCLEPLTHLTQLEAPSARISDAGLAYLARFRSMYHLDLQSTRVTDAGLVHLRDLQRLRSLGLSRTGITDAGLSALPKLDGLEALDLSYTAVTDAGLKHLAEQPKLEYLDLTGTRVTDAGLPCLAALPRLRLNVEQTLTTGEGRRALRKASPYCFINPVDTKGYLFPMGTTDDDLQSSDIHEDEAISLYLADAAIGDDALAIIARCTSLHCLDLSGTKITDAGLAHLTGLENLHELYLERTGVTDAGLQHLASRHFHSLNTVSLGGTKATPSGPMSLRRAHPMCKFIAFRAARPNQLDKRFGKKPKVFPSSSPPRTTLTGLGRPNGARAWQRDATTFGMVFRAQGMNSSNDPMQLRFYLWDHTTNQWAQFGGDYDVLAGANMLHTLMAEAEIASYVADGAIRVKYALFNVARDKEVGTGFSDIELERLAGDDAKDYQEKQVKAAIGQVQ